MERMIKLRNLDIREAGLEYLPEGVRNWKSLQTLSNFIVSSATEGCKIEELKHHNLLQDCVKIEWVGDLKSVEQAAEARLQAKSQLTELELDFYFGEEIVLASTPEALEEKRLMESVLGVLQPHSNLKKFTISEYSGFKFPSWMGDTITAAQGWEVWEFANGEIQVGVMMPRVTSINIHNCPNLIAFPALNKLPSLKKLKIEYADKLTSISREFYCNGCNTLLFPKLVDLDIGNMKNLEVLVLGAITDGEKVDTSSDIGILPGLKSLTIHGCPVLKSLRFLTKSVPSLEEIPWWTLKEFKFRGDEQEEEEEADLSLLPRLLNLDFLDSEEE
ncbi:putative disease resistance RPP13-like protein 1 [Papaver somniferum]|uniref:putative disease resistance RPP13-like protein 1 n=1 Tax=Papaver somniferum TaxID=3469 RepID=UPI000E6F863D|nr:putative disease resistance RPP13-like protein 1 [Papaver somniferum]